MQMPSDKHSRRLAPSKSTSTLVRLSPKRSTTLQMLGVPSKMLYFPDEAQYALKPQNSQLWYKNRQRLGRSVAEEMDRQNEAR